MELLLHGPLNCWFFPLGIRLGKDPGLLKS